MFLRKSSFHSRDIQIFVFQPSPLFLPVSHCSSAWSKINLKIYDDVINCLSMNLIIHFVWYLEKEKKVSCWNFGHWYSIKKGTFLWKNHAENVHQTQVPDPFFILVNNPKQSLHTRNYFKNKIFWKGINKSL